MPGGGPSNLPTPLGPLRIPNPSSPTYEADLVTFLGEQFRRDLIADPGRFGPGPIGATPISTQPTAAPHLSTTVPPSSVPPKPRIETPAVHTVGPIRQSTIPQSNGWAVGIVASLVVVAGIGITAWLNSQSKHENEPLSNATHMLSTRFSSFRQDGPPAKLRPFYPPRLNSSCGTAFTGGTGSDGYSWTGVVDGPASSCSMLEQYRKYVDDSMPIAADTKLVRRWHNAFGATISGLKTFKGAVVVVLVDSEVRAIDIPSGRNLWSRSCGPGDRALFDDNSYETTNLDHVVSRCYRSGDRWSQDPRTGSPT